MDKVNKFSGKDEGRPLRITRARAKALRGIPPYSRSSPKNEQKNVKKASSKRPASDTNSFVDAKRRAVLEDLTNINTQLHYKPIKASKVKAKRVYQKKNTKLASNVSIEVLSSEEDAREKLVDELSTIKMVESNDTIAAPTLDIVNVMSNNITDNIMTNSMLSVQGSMNINELLSSQNKDIDMICEKLGDSDCLAIVDIDFELKDCHVWSSYALDMYNNVRVTELGRRPSTDYMEKLQKDINPNMRAILIDWLVEVTDEYKLVPDTLYLTVNLIDRFLSTSLVQKQRLQLLGVTCMFIASKYEEISAPKVEEFCNITDNTYTKEEVLKMETKILNILNFQLAVPTTKTFLRRFIQVAQSSHKVASIELEFLANYLGELTLVEYSFLQFLPSLVAASAVFLARWTLNLSEHPWNPTLEHYTSYKTSELKTVVLALEDLQLNTKGSSLTAIREKYTHKKFNCVAKLSPKPVQSLFKVEL